MKEKNHSLVIYGLILICLAFTLGYLFGTGNGRTEVTITTQAPQPALEAVEQPEEPPAEAEAAEILPPTAENPLDLNTARQDQLELLPGVGEGIAKRIIAYRTTIGPFLTKEQLMDVEGIGEKRFAEIEPLVTIGGTP